MGNVLTDSFSTAPAFDKIYAKWIKLPTCVLFI